MGEIEKKIRFMLDLHWFDCCLYVIHRLTSRVSVFGNSIGLSALLLMAVMGKHVNYLHRRRTALTVGGRLVTLLLLTVLRVSLKPAVALACINVFFVRDYACVFLPAVGDCRFIKQEAFDKCWAHSPQRAASRPFSRCR